MYGGDLKVTTDITGTEPFIRVEKINPMTLRQNIDP